MSVDPFEFGWWGFRFWRKHEIGKKLGRKFFPKITAKHAAKRAARQAGQALPAESVETVTMFAGRKTYLGIFAAALGLALGWLGIGQCDPAVAECLSSDRIMSSLNEVLEIGGLLVAAYGRKVAKPSA